MHRGPSGTTVRGMTPPVNMNTVIHGAVRRDLRRITDALAAPDAAAKADRIAAAYDFLDAELHYHHESEDTLLWPALVEHGVPAELTATMASEHQAMALALERAKEAVHAFAASGDAADAAAAKAALEHATEVTTAHLDHEENEIGPLFEDFASTPAWPPIEKKLRSRSPKAAGQFFAWIQDGMSDEHRAYLGSTVPPPVRFLLTKGFGRGYRSTAAL